MRSICIINIYFSNVTTILEQFVIESVMLLQIYIFKYKLIFSSMYTYNYNIIMYIIQMQISNKKEKNPFS